MKTTHTEKPKFPRVSLRLSGAGLWLWSVKDGKTKVIGKAVSVKKARLAAKRCVGRMMFNRAAKEADRKEKKYVLRILGVLRHKGFYWTIRTAVRLTAVLKASEGK